MAVAVGDMANPLVASQEVVVSLCCALSQTLKSHAAPNSDVARVRGSELLAARLRSHAQQPEAGKCHGGSVSEGQRDAEAACAMKKVWVRCCKGVLLRHFRELVPAREQNVASVHTLSAQFDTFLSARRDAERIARMKALKENDAEAYLEHVSDMKLGSLLGIMETTHKFMLKLGAKLDMKQAEAAHAPGGGAAIPEGLCRVSRATQASNDFRRFKEYVASTKDEYKLVHKNAIFVEAQPAGLDATLMPHQMVGLRFLVSLQANGINGILADEMGVGKTIQTLAFLLHLKATHRLYGPHLVLAPLSIIREWRDACATFVSASMRVCELHEMALPAREAPSFDIVLLAIHRVKSCVESLRAVSWAFVVVDEGHKAVSNPQTQTAQAISAIPFKHRLVLTGTPLNSDIQELFALLNFINPTLFDERATFDDIFRKPFSGTGLAGQDMELNEEERTLLVMRLHQILRPFMLRRTKKDIDDSLRITYHEVRCPLTPLQSETLRILREQQKLPQMVHEECRMGSVCTKETTAQQLCNHAFMVSFFSQLLLREKVDTDTHEAGLMTLRCSGKFMVLDVLLRRAFAVGQKVVVFSHWLDTIDLLEEFVAFRGWSDNCVVLTGTSSADERRECVSRFRSDPGTRLFVVSMKAGGCGLNLQVASLIVLLDKDYTATNEDQAIARVFRIGQRNIVRAIYLTTNDESEQRIAMIADRKNRPRQAIIEAGSYHVEAVTEEERRRELELHGSSSVVQLIDCSGPTSRAAASAAFDHLLTDDKALVDSCLRSAGSDNSLMIEESYTSLAEVPVVLLKGLQECAAAAANDAEACGRGKRERNDDILLKAAMNEPSAAAIERMMARHDVDEEDALELLKDEALAKRRMRLEQVACLLGFQGSARLTVPSLGDSVSDATFTPETKVAEVSLRSVFSRSDLHSVLSATSQSSKQSRPACATQQPLPYVDNGAAAPGRRSVSNESAAGTLGTPGCEGRVRTTSDRHDGGRCLELE